VETLSIENIVALMDKYETNELAFEGTCADCGKEVCVVVRDKGNGEFVVTGGAAYGNAETEIFRAKCDVCFMSRKALQFQECDVYSRVVGYMRPVRSWNMGKQAEFRNRKMMRPGAEG